MDAERLRELSQKIATDPSEVYNLSPEEAVELSRYLNPLGNVISEDKEYVNLSITNWTEQYWRKFLVTSLVAYIYRLQSEYLPEDEIEASRTQMERELATATAEEIPAIRAAHDSRTKLLTKTARAMVLKFLNRNFNFNPDHHLRAAPSENPSDPERKPRADEIIARCKIAETASTIEAKLQSKPDPTYNYLRSHLLTVYQTAVDVTQTVKSAITSLMDPMLDPSDKQGILLKKYKVLLGICADMKKIAEPLSTADTLAAWKVDPPADVFHQFDRYVSNHYEQLREVCAALYNEKPDIEYAVIFYKSFHDAEAAAQHRKQHESHFRAEVLTLENTGVSLIGPFKENRSRVEFYNKHVEIMKRMMEQMETDHKLGKDLMEKQVKKKKRENIARDGPDAPGLREYSKAMNTMAELGAKKILTREEQEKLEAAAKIREDVEVPADAIQVDMFYPTTDESGETVLAKKKMYTQAEAPLHLQEGSEYHDKYQPVRSGGNITEAYVTKTIISKDGQKREIKVLAPTVKDVPKDKEEL